MKTENRTAKAKAKKEGQAAAKRWLEGAPTQAWIDLAGCDFEYGDTLREVRKDGYDVPDFPDPDFSWGFYKQVKSHVHHQVQRGRRDSSR